jgi:hypothetical protein
MPILSPDYMGVYKAVFIDGKYRLLKNFTETRDTQVKSIDGLFADIGTHLVQINNQEIKANFSSDILLFQKFDNTKSETITDAYELALENLAVIREPIASNNSLEYFLNSLEIKVDSSNVDVTVKVTSLNFPEFALDGTQLSKGGFEIVADSPPLDFYGRTAKFYDTIFSIFGNDYLVASGSISLAVENEKNYLINNNSDNPYDNIFPKYSITGYSATGSITLVVRQDQYDTLKLASIQPPGIFAPFEKQIKFKVFDKVNGDKTLNLGDLVFLPKIDFDLNTNIIKCNINFTTMFRRTSTITF